MLRPMSDPEAIDQPPFIYFPPFEVFYLVSLEFCTLSAMASATQVVALMEQRKSGGERFTPQEALNEVQNIVNQGAAISRYFWPSDKKYRARGEALRKAFGIDDLSPLRDRKLRNMVEHFDEYLDDYLRQTVAGQFVPDYFGPSPDEDRGPLKLFRAFFTDIGIFEVLGEAFSIQPILDAIFDLHEMLEAAYKNGSRFPKIKNEQSQ